MSFYVSVNNSMLANFSLDILDRIVYLIGRCGPAWKPLIIIMYNLNSKISNMFDIIRVVE